MFYRQPDSSSSPNSSNTNHNEDKDNILGQNLTERVTVSSCMRCFYPEFEFNCWWLFTCQRIKIDLKTCSVDRHVCTITSHVNAPEFEQFD